jgi:uncharacterized protein YndB with AHSA1/START domain
VGNTTQGQNLGDGAKIYKGKAGGNLLQFRSISPTGGSIQIYQVDDKILISGGSSGSVTSVAAGDGMNFTTITGTGSVALGTPSTLTLTTTNTVGTNTHCHALNIANFTTSAAGLAPASGGGTTNFLRADGSWAAPAGSVTSVAAGDGMNFTTITGTGSVALGTPSTLTLTTTNTVGTNTHCHALSIANFTTSAAGLAPASGGGTTNFLRADGSWVAPSGGGLDAYAALTSGAIVTWDASGGLNKTLNIAANFTLALTNLSNGMSGDLRINNTTASTITITLPASNSRLNGSVNSLPAGIYHLTWTYSGTYTDFSIAQYVTYS